MLRYKIAIIVDADKDANACLKKSIGESSFRQIISFDSVKDAWVYLTEIKIKTSVEVLFLNSESTRDAAELISQIMSDPDLSHIKIVVIVSRHNRRALNEVFQNGAVAQVDSPQDVAGLNRILERLSKRTG